MDLETIADAYWEPLVKYCYNLLFDYHLAEDAVQDVLIKAAKKLPDLRDQVAIQPWLYKIAYNTCIDMLRRRRIANLFISQEKAQTPGAHEDYYDFGISEDLQAALDTLSPRDRALLYSRAVDGFEYSELEAIYGVKAATLYKRYERVKKKIEKELQYGPNRKAYEV